eukprot:15460346-Alexandrium_andersonii.AAC.1
MRSAAFSAQLPKSARQSETPRGPKAPNRDFATQPTPTRNAPIRKPRNPSLFGARQPGPINSLDAAGGATRRGRKQRAVSATLACSVCGEGSCPRQCGSLVPKRDHLWHGSTPALGANRS